MEVVVAMKVTRVAVVYSIFKVILGKALLLGGELIKPEIKKNAKISFAGTIWCSLHLNNILLFDFFPHLKCPDFSVKVEIFVISALSSSFY